MAHVRTIDCLGLKCPLPVLRVEKELANLASGASFILLANDPVARIDIVHYCRSNGHGVTLSEDAGHLRFEIIHSGS